MRLWLEVERVRHRHDYKASIYSNLAHTPTANPVIADADGFLASFYWTGTVDVVLTDENDNLIDSAQVFKTFSKYD